MYSMYVDESGLGNNYTLLAGNIIKSCPANKQTLLLMAGLPYYLLNKDIY